MPSVSNRSGVHQRAPWVMLCCLAMPACGPATTSHDGGVVPERSASDGGAPSDAHDGEPCDGSDRVARVLFIGNSYTAHNGGLDKALTTLAAGHDSCGFSLTAARHAPGGRIFVQHAEDATTPGNALYDLLRDPLGWDVVVLQEQSQIPGFGDEDEYTLASRAALKDTLVPLAEAAGARVVLLMTWGYRDGDPINPATYPDYSTMQAAIASGYEAYRSLAETVATRPVALAPAGLAFARVHDDEVAPAVGEAAASARFSSLYADDGSHPGPLGSYLAAAVLFQTITRLDAGGVPTIDGLSATDKAWLDEAVRGAGAANP